MKKPEKKEIILKEPLEPICGAKNIQHLAYKMNETRNQTIDDYERFSPSENEIAIIVDRVYFKWEKDNQGFVTPITLIAHAIADRIGKNEK